MSLSPLTTTTTKQVRKFKVILGLFIYVTPNTTLSDQMLGEVYTWWMLTELGRVFMINPNTNKKPFLLMERAIVKCYLISASLKATSSSFLCRRIAVLSASLLACC